MKTTRCLSSLPSFFSLLSALLLTSLICSSPNIDAATTESFSESGTWQCPVGVTQIKVECWGAGGAGGQGRTTTTVAGGGGGGGGAYASVTLTVTPGSFYTYTVGTGGATITANGGDSFFANTSTVLAKGGLGGGAATSGVGGAGGSGGASASCVGDVKYSGGAGATGAAGGGAQAGGAGGASAGFYANGNAAATTTPGSSQTGGAAGGTAATSAAGGAGHWPGGGGGGPAGSAGVNSTPGTGGGGKVAITYTLPTGDPELVSEYQQLEDIKAILTTIAANTAGNSSVTVDFTPVIAALDDITHIVEACAIAGGLAVGLVLWRLILLSKNQRSLF